MSLFQAVPQQHSRSRIPPQHQIFAMPEFAIYSQPGPEATYQGSCHCGLSRFTVTMPPLDTLSVISCNCSICTMKGLLHVYPLRHKLVFESGYDNLESYYFASQTCQHMFCKTCGTSLMVALDKWPAEHLKKHVALNVSARQREFKAVLTVYIRQVRVLKDVDLDSLKFERLDGKNFV